MFQHGISVEVLIQDRFVSSIRCCLQLSYFEYHVLGEVQCCGKWIIYKGLHSRYVVPNEYVGSDSVSQLLSILMWNMDESHASKATGMVQNGFLLCLASYGVVPTTDHFGVHFSR